MVGGLGRLALLGQETPMGRAHTPPGPVHPGPDEPLPEEPDARPPHGGPRLPRVYVPRPRLWERLDRATASAVTLLVAPGGAGERLRGGRRRAPTRAAQGG